jgi:hypothetical protein
MAFCCSSDLQVYAHSHNIPRLVLTVPVFAYTQGTFSGIFFSALGPVLSEVVPLSDFSDALSIIWLVCAPITLVCTPIAFALDEYSNSILGMTGSDMFQITIGTAAAANIAAAIALFVVKRFQRKEQDV